MNAFETASVFSAACARFSEACSTTGAEQPIAVIEPMAIAAAANIPLRFMTLFSLSGLSTSLQQPMCHGIGRAIPGVYGRGPVHLSRFQTGSVAGVRAREHRGALSSARASPFGLRVGRRHGPEAQHRELAQELRGRRAVRLG